MLPFSPGDGIAGTNQLSSKEGKEYFRLDSLPFPPPQTEIYREENGPEIHANHH